MLCLLCDIEQHFYDVAAFISVTTVYRTVFIRVSNVVEDLRLTACVITGKTCAHCLLCTQ